MSGWVQPIDHIALRLADEGVPLRAIARAIDMPSADIRVTLQNACANGMLVQMPRDDWPPGVDRDKRLLHLARLALANKTALRDAVMQLFEVTPTQAKFFLAVVFQRELCRSAVEKSNQNINVQMLKLRRKIEPFGLKIETLWSSGYGMTLENRRKAFQLLAKVVRQKL